MASMQSSTAGGSSCPAQATAYRCHALAAGVDSAPSGHEAWRSRTAREATGAGEGGSDEAAAAASVAAATQGDPASATGWRPP